MVNPTFRKHSTAFRIALNGTVVAYELWQYSQGVPRGEIFIAGIASVILINLIIWFMTRVSPE